MGAGDGFQVVTQVGGAPPAGDARKVPLNAVLVVADERAVAAVVMLLLRLPLRLDDEEVKDEPPSLRGASVAVAEVETTVPCVGVMTEEWHRVG